MSLTEQDSNLLLNQLSNNAVILHQEQLNVIVQEQELGYVKAFGLKPFKDGNQWCYLLGDNIQEGVCGFGETPYKAMLAFNKAFNFEKAL